MNFSEPGCGATTTININASTPLDLAHTLFADIVYPTRFSDVYPTNYSDFIRHLTAIHDAAYLLLLPQTCPAEVEISQAETDRISNEPLGDAVLQATALFYGFRRNIITNNNSNSIDDDTYRRAEHSTIYSATGLMLASLAAEESRYHDNMAALLAAMRRKWKKSLVETGSWHHTARTMGKSGIASAQALAEFVNDRPAPPPHRRGRYLEEIARYWRKWRGTGEAGRYEEVWCFVAGRGLVQE